jgi:hypothetical protein
VEDVQACWAVWPTRPILWPNFGPLGLAARGQGGTASHTSSTQRAAAARRSLLDPTPAASEASCKQAAAGGPAPLRDCWCRRHPCAAARLLAAAPGRLGGLYQVQAGAEQLRSSEQSSAPTPSRSRWMGEEKGMKPLWETEEMKLEQAMCLTRRQ